jgi:hypothetical protein
MGLDITAYSRLSRIDAVFDADGEPIDPKTREPLEGDYTQITVNSDFPGREGSLVHRGCYTYADHFGFRAGSYGGYTGWRERLAELADFPLAPYKRFEGAPAVMRRDAAAWAGQCEGLPFVELVNFSDCEGTIGAEVAAKLANDFAEHQHLADKVADDALFIERYAMWRKAFEMAADGGAVCFH